VVAGPPIDLSRWAGTTPSKAVLHEMTDAIMERLREMLAEVRGAPAPPIYEPPNGRVRAEPQPPRPTGRQAEGRP